MDEKKPILIIDNNDDDFNVFREMLSDDYEIIEARDEDIAYDIAKSNADSIAVILVNVEMFYDSGRGIIADFHSCRSTSDIPFIAIAPPGEENSRLFKCGAWDIVTKPFSPEILAARINNIIEKRYKVELIKRSVDKEENSNMLSYIDVMPLPFISLKVIGDPRDEKGAIIVNYANDCYLNLIGADQSIIGKRIENVLPGFSLVTEKEYVMAAICDNGYVGHTVRKKYKDRQFELFFFSPKADCCACLLKDITDSERLKQQNVDALLRENRLLSEKETEHERYRTIIEQMGVLVFEWDRDKKTAYISSGIDKFDIPEKIEPIFTGNYDTSEFVYPADREKLRKEFFEQLKTRRRHNVTVRLRKKNGAYIWCKVYATSFFNEKGRYLRTFGSIQDINREVLYLEQLRRAVEYDDLTKIYNKNSFYKQTALMLKENESLKFSIIRFDIDRFKVVNENFGFEQGNKFLVYIAKFLKQKLANVTPCVYARMEADIFCICAQRDVIVDLLPAVENIGDGFNLDFDVVPSVGIYHIENTDIPIDVMVDRAKLAMLTVKGNYLIRHAYFDEKLHTSLIREQEIINMMNAALEEEQFHVYLQPKFTLGRMRICGAEALARWIHPVKGMIMPGDFIPIFERNGFIMKLDEYIWEKVCILLRSELDRGMNVLPISINISKKDIYNSSLVDIIIGLVEKYEIPVNLFQLELTESAYIDDAVRLTDVMNRLRNYGFTMMMDDFGSGYSSLNMLKEIPVDVLKLDLRFLADKNGSTGGKGGSIIASVMHMAKWLNLRVITEGIETGEQAEFLRSIGCPDGQGYYFAKPVTVDEYERLIFNQKEIILPNSPRDDISLNIDEIWNPDSKPMKIFSSMFSAIAIYEYTRGNFEAIRVNDKYFDLFEITYDEFYFHSIHIKDNIPEEDHAEMVNLIEQAFKTKESVEGIIHRKVKSGKTLVLRCYVMFLNGDEEHGLYLASMKDITEQSNKNRDKSEEARV